MNPSTTPTRVTLRETFSGFANVANGWRILGVDVTPRQKNADDGTGRDVVVELPAGIYISESMARDLQFYDFADGKCCTFTLVDAEHPALLTDRGCMLLKVVE